MNDHGSHGPSRPILISTAEFDRKVEAGEDIDMHLDWDNAVSIEPGELSPEQKSAVAREEGWEASGSNGEASESFQPLYISLPRWAFEQLQNDASRQGIRQEELAQMLLLQRLDKQRTAA